MSRKLVAGKKLIRGAINLDGRISKTDADRIIRFAVKKTAVCYLTVSPHSEIINIIGFDRLRKKVIEYNEEKEAKV